MLHFGEEEGFRRLNQIQKPALWCLWKHSALAGLNRNSELSLAVPITARKDDAPAAY
jgi:hypothetical protein